MPSAMRRGSSACGRRGELTAAGLGVYDPLCIIYRGGCHGQRALINRPPVRPMQAATIGNRHGSRCRARTRPEPGAQMVRSFGHGARGAAQCRHEAGRGRGRSHRRTELIRRRCRSSFWTARRISANASPSRASSRPRRSRAPPLPRRGDGKLANDGHVAGRAAGQGRGVRSTRSASAACRRRRGRDRGPQGQRP